MLIGGVPTPDTAATGRGWQGEGSTVGVRDEPRLRSRRRCPDGLVEEVVAGDDLWVVVIDPEVVAAAVRRPATVVGNRVSDVTTPIRRTSRRRERAPAGGRGSRWTTRRPPSGPAAPSASR